MLPAESEEDNWMEAGQEKTVYTDGTYAQNGMVVEWSTGRERTEAAAGVVISSGMGDNRLRVTGEIQMTSAYDAEVIALTVAGRMLRGATIYSDCQSAMTATSLVQQRTGIVQVLRMADGYGNVRKVAAHAERRKLRADWTPEEEGNVKADATAAGREDANGNPLKTYLYVQLSNGLHHIGG
jgi:ribonuclease HI